MFNFIINSFRLIALTITCIFYGVPLRLFLLYVCDKFSFPIETSRNAQKKLGNSVAQWLQSSGPAFIKFGQVLSTRPDLTGDIISEKLSFLQDSLPPFSFNYAKHVIESQLGSKVDELFEFIDEKPVAAASIAQVHKARTKYGQDVAVKILRPGIEKRFKKDVQLFYFLAKLSKIFPEAKRLHFVDAVKTFEKIVNNELNLLFEAACADKLRENCAKDAGVRIPMIFWDLSSQRVMTAEWIEGIRIDDKEGLEKAGHDPHEIAKKLAITFFNQAYRDGFFHADLHPGNLLVDANGNIALVDFGIMGFLEKRDRLFIAHMLYAFMKRDYDLVSELHFQVGYIPKHMDKKKFALACRSIGEPIIGLPVNQISIAKLLKQLLNISKDFEMELQTQLILLQKTMVTLEGVGYTIYPEVNMWKLAEPWIKKWAKDNFGFKAKLKNVRKDIKILFSKFPHLLVQVSDLIEKGDSVLDLVNKGGKARELKKASLFYGWVTHPLTALLAGFGIAAVYFAI